VLESNGSDSDADFWLAVKRSKNVVPKNGAAETKKTTRSYKSAQDCGGEVVNLDSDEEPEEKSFAKQGKWSSHKKEAVFCPSSAAPNFVKGL